MANIPTVLNFFEQTTGDSRDNPLNLGGTIKGADGNQAAAIADPAGGATVDAEARTAINDILAMLRNTQLIQT